MIDIHSHIIPFVDDGSKSLEDSITMIKKAIENGVDTIYATPHYIKRVYTKNVEEIRANFKLLEDEVKRLNLPIKLYLGQEILYTGREDIISKLDKKELLTMNNSQYVLLEFNFTHEIEDVVDVIYNFSIHNYIVIIAHVERYDWINMDKIIKFKKEGALIQVNSNSVLGLDGGKRKRFVKKLLKNNLVDFVASDTHYFRESTLAKSYKKIKNEDLFNAVALKNTKELVK